MDVLLFWIFFINFLLLWICSDIKFALVCVIFFFSFYFSFCSVALDMLRYKFCFSLPAEIKKIGFSCVEIQERVCLRYFTFKKLHMKLTWVFYIYDHYLFLCFFSDILNCYGKIGMPVTFFF